MCTYMFVPASMCVPENVCVCDYVDACESRAEREPAPRGSRAKRAPPVRDPPKVSTPVLVYLEPPSRGMMYGRFDIPLRRAPRVKWRAWRRPPPRASCESGESSEEPFWTHWLLFHSRNTTWIRQRMFVLLCRWSVDHGRNHKLCVPCSCLTIILIFLSDMDQRLMT